MFVYDNVGARQLVIIGLMVNMKLVVQKGFYIEIEGLFNGRVGG